MSPANKDITLPASSAAARLTEKAAAIHALVKHTKKNIIEIGRHLAEAHDQIEHGAWSTWLYDEFSWSDQTARNFIHVYEVSRNPKTKRVLNLDLPLRVLYQIAAPKAEAAREEIAKRAEAGEAITTETVKKAIAGTKGAKKKAKAEPPAEPQAPAERPAQAEAGPGRLDRELESVRTTASPKGMDLIAAQSEIEDLKEQLAARETAGAPKALTTEAIVEWLMVCVSAGTLKEIAEELTRVVKKSDVSGLLPEDGSIPPFLRRESAS